MDLRSTPGVSNYRHILQVVHIVQMAAIAPRTRAPATAPTPIEARPLAPPPPEPYPYPLSLLLLLLLELLDPPPIAVVWKAVNVWSAVGLTAKTMPDLQWPVVWQKNQTGLVSATVKLKVGWLVALADMLCDHRQCR
jgi:hypothetical protein